ncbi:MAG: hypothetical protein J7598_18915 [Mitsuaria chitosanitabida]|nr:hypothetical protein [Roseateles chitosanitabidus]
MAMLLVLLSVDVTPNLANTSLDSSWGQGIEAALRMGLVPGRDLLFTYGPFAAMTTGVWGQGYGLGLTLSLAVALSLAVMLRETFPQRFLPASVLIFVASLNNETLFYAYLAVIPLALVRRVRDGERASRPARLALGSALLLVPAMALSKLSFAPVGCVLLVASCAYLFVAPARRQALGAAMAAPIAVAGWWMLCGQELADLPRFLTNLEIIKGYTAAMEWDLNAVVAGVDLQFVEACALYGCAGVLVYRLAAQAPRTRDRLFLLAALGAVGLVAVKAGVVRHDAGHTIVSWLVLMLWALLSPQWPEAGAGPRWLGRGVIGLGVAAVLISVIVFDGAGLRGPLYTAKTYAQREGIDWSSQKRSLAFWSTFLAREAGPFLTSLPLPLPGLEARWHNLVDLARFARHSPSDQQRLAYAALGRQCGLPGITGSADIYPIDINCLLAVGASWAPRPVFQSYSAYTPALIQANLAHVAGSSAPDNLFIAIKPIDRHLPALEDGASWTCIAQRYRSVDDLAPASRWLHLRRLEGDPPGPTCAEPPLVRSIAARLAQPVTLSCDQSAQIVGMDFMPTGAGRLASLAYKTRRLEIDVETCDGMAHSFRFVPAMAVVPFPLSPLVTDTAALSDLLAGRDLSSRRVRSFVIRYSDSESPVRGWAQDYTVRLYGPMSAAPSGRTAP